MEESKEKVIQWIRIDLIDDHPENDEIFGVDLDRDNLLGIDIEKNGVKVPCTVNEKPNGRFRLLSGHQRKAASIKSGNELLPCFVERIPEDSEVDELLSYNAGRAMRLHYKLRYFKVLKKKIREFKKDVEKSGGLTGDILKKYTTVENLATGGFDLENMRVWEIIHAATGLSEYEQKALTKVCDEDYRDKAFPTIKSPKKQAAFTQIKDEWYNVELLVMSGDMKLVDAEKKVNLLIKQIEAIANPPKHEAKPVEKPKPEAPFKAEKQTEVNGSLYTNTYENAYKFLEGLSLRTARTGQLKETWSWSLNEVATEMERWANLVLQNQ